MGLLRLLSRRRDDATPPEVTAQNTATVIHDLRQLSDNLQSNVDRLETTMQTVEQHLKE